MSVLAIGVLAASLLVAQGHGDPVIAGQVAEANGAPVAQAEVIFTAGPTREGIVPIVEHTTTDASGGFRLARPSADRMRGCAAAGSIVAYKPGLGVGIADLFRGDWPGQTHRLVLEPVAKRTISLRDAAGKPVAGARVAPRIVVTEQTGYMGVAIPDRWLDRFTATTDAAGVAVVTALARQTELRSVRTTIAGKAAQVLSLPYDKTKEDTTLHLGRPSRLAGAVKTDAGVAAMAASVEVWLRSNVPVGRGRSLFMTPEVVHIESEPIHTDAQGSFQSPPVCLTGLTYRLVVRADGFAPAVSAWVTARGDATRIPAVVLHRLRRLSGRVVNRGGTPVAGAHVFQPAGGRPAGTTDAVGRFRLENALPGRTFLLARADGFRFEGRPIGIDEKGTIELMLTRSGEPPHPRKLTLPEPIPLAESRVLARRVLDPFLQKAVAKGDDAAKLWSLRVLRWLDPAELLERAQKTRIQYGNTSDYLQQQAALAVAAVDIGEAATIAESIGDPSNRADALIAIFDTLPTAKREQARDLLEAAALQATAGSPSSSKLYVMGEVAERWLELGEHARAMCLFTEGRKLVEALPPLKRTDAGSFLARLGRVEPAAALALLKDVGSRRWRDRATANLAIRLAYEHPAEAEHVLSELDEPLWRFTAARRICRRLARTDPARARRIAAGLPVASERAYAWAFLADGLAATDHDGAHSALDRALHEIDRIDPYDLSHAAEVNPAVSILPLVERLAPERLAEVFWRAVALSPDVGDPRLDFGTGERFAPEVLLLARYDHEVAAALFEPLADYVRGHSLRDGTDIPETIFLARAAFDPRGAVAMLESLPSAQTLNVNELINWARCMLAEHLAEPPERRWVSIWRQYAGCGMALFGEVYRNL